ncbi:MAG: SpoIIE family protein phosphatase [Synechococcaceae cyanobacterium SM2_3_1]|nr:SpoIIE family protein phosphatase [Synechococcaceae cyanobacterium SM2_3_1]
MTKPLASKTLPFKMSPLRQQSSPGVPVKVLLIVPFVVQTVAAVGLVGFLSFRNGQQAVNDLASQLGLEISERVQERILVDLSIPHRLNETTAGLIESGVIPVTDIGRLELHFWKLIPPAEQITETFIARPDGSFTGTRWSEEQLVFDTATTASAVEPDGTRGEILDTFPDYDPRVRTWYQEAVTSEAAIWSQIYPDYTTNILGITAAQPIYDAEGNLEGVIGSSFLMTLINQFMQQLEVGETGMAFVLEPTGDLVTSSRDTPLQVRQGEEVQRLSAAESPDPVIQETARFLLEMIPDLNSIQSVKQMKFSFNDEAHFLQIKPIQDDYGLSWLLVTVLPERDFMAQIQANTRTTILLCGLALVIAILTGILTARWITQPLLRLVHASETMALGKLDQQVDPAPIRELRILGEAFNSMARQLKESFNTLENRVQERTEELRAANVQILALNQQLHQENLRMGAELEVTRRLQQAILPRPGELEGITELDIVGYMEPAVEVGGDYYDVLRYNGTVTIGIGDVTGHGLESGILSIMVQTAVRALAVASEVDARQFIGVLNRALYDNIQRMGSDKNLSFLLVHYQDNRLLISGQHESVIIARANGDLELVDTDELGFPIGLEPEIHSFLHSYEGNLFFGDTLVLYTDGIPEAEDAAGVLYGLDRLCTMVQENHHLTAAGIRDAIINDLKQHIGAWTIDDDVTLVVLKHIFPPG